MADEVRAYDLVVPAGTAIATPATFDVSFPPRTVERVEIVVPSGCNYLVGFWVGSSGTRIIPVQAGQWIVTDGETITADTIRAHSSGSWMVTAYNLGRLAHTLRARFAVNLPGRPGTASVPALLPTTSLSFTA